MTQAAQEVAPRPQGSLPVAATPAKREVISGDIVIPRLLLMQGLSEFVSDRKAQQGDIVRNTTVDVLGDPEATIDFIPLKIVETWAEKERVGQKFSFRRSFPRTNANDGLPWSFWRNPQGEDFDRPGMLGATEWQRVKSIDVFAILTEDVDDFEAEMRDAIGKGEIPDLNKTLLPVVISFRSMSFNAGKTVSTLFAKVSELQAQIPDLTPQDYVLTLGCKPQKNDKGQFFVYEVGQPKKLDAKYKPVAKKWAATLSGATEIKVDSTGDGEAVAEGERY